MEYLRTGILGCACFSILWLECTLNVIFYAIIIGLIIGLVWLSIFTAISTSFLWLPMCLICAPLLMTVVIMIRVTRLRETCTAYIAKLQEEPLKSAVWVKGILVALNR